jgi:alpha-ketoglutarate-dependent taurine dioxygenase
VTDREPLRSRGSDAPSPYRQRVAQLTPVQRAALVSRLQSTAPVRATEGPIPRARRTASLPLSPVQRGIWVRQSLDPAGAAYNMSIRLHLAGRLDHTVLASSVSEVVRRHEVLRTRYVVHEDLPEQVIGPAGPVEIALADLSGLDDRARRDRTAALVAAEAERPFDLATDLMVRARLLRWAADEHVLLLTTHHIACDGWSIGIFAHELSALYEAGVTGRPSPLPALPLQYADYAVWESARLANGTLDASLAYWRRQLRPPLEALQLPIRLFPPQTATRLAASAPFAAPAALADPPRAARSFIWALAAFEALMHCWSGQTVVVLGTDVASRDRRELEPLIGCLINQFVLRTDLSDDPSFAEIVRRAERVVDDAFAHRHVPFEQVVQMLNPQRGSSPPLFRVKVVGSPWLGKPRLPEWRLPGVTVTPLVGVRRTTPFDLTLFIHHGPAGVSGDLEYNTDLFDAPTISRLLEDYTAILGRVAAEPEIRLTALRGLLRRKEGTRMTAPIAGNGRTISLRHLTPKALDEAVEQAPEECFPFGETLPVLEARSGQPPLREWLAAHTTLVERRLQTYGALLLRGIPLQRPEDLEDVARLFGGDLFDGNGEHPREAGSRTIYTPVFYPPEQKLLWHNENSFNRSWPMTIWFGCVTPAQEGGETPIVDSRAHYARLDPRLRARFEEADVMYVRTYHKGLGLDWQTIFQTTSRAEVEQRCRAEGIDIEWGSDDTLRTRAVRRAVARHPVTGAKTWFNQVPHWHPSCLDARTRESLLELFGEDDLPRDCRYGDGSRIDDGTVAEILAAYQELEVVFPWRASDVLMVDNMAVAHARNAFRGPRKLLVALARMMSWDDLR